MTDDLTKPEFNVVQFFENGTHEYVRRWVTADEAVKAAQHYTRSVAAQCGMVVRVIITDGGDDTVFEWKYGQGITWPSEAKSKA